MVAAIRTAQSLPVVIRALPVQTGRLCRRSGNSMSNAMRPLRSEEHTSELQSLMRISYAVFCLKKKIQDIDYSNRAEVRTIIYLTRAVAHRHHSPTHQTQLG